MKKYLLVLLVASMFAGCGYELNKKGEAKRITTVHMDVGKFQVVGDVEYKHNGRVEFTEIGGMEITTHISKCVIVENVPQPAIPQVNPPAPPETPQEVPEEKPDK